MDTDIYELRAKAREAMDAAEAVAGKWESEGRDPRPDERKKYDRLITRADRLALNLTLAEQEETERQKRRQAARGLTLGIGPEWERRVQYGSSTRPGHIRVSSEPLTYEARSSHSFFKDLVAAERGTDMGLGNVWRATRRR